MKKSWKREASHSVDSHAWLASNKAAPRDVSPLLDVACLNATRSSSLDPQQPTGHTPPPPPQPRRGWVGGGQWSRSLGYCIPGFDSARIGRSVAILCDVIATAFCVFFGRFTFRLDFIVAALISEVLERYRTFVVPPYFCPPYFCPPYFCSPYRPLTDWLTDWTVINHAEVESDSRECLYYLGRAGLWQAFFTAYGINRLFL